MQAQRTRKDIKNIHVKAATSPRPIKELLAKTAATCLTES
jgi:hypothetical protein